VLLSAALKAVPDDIIEAARLDGVNAWQMFRNITIPSIRPTLVVVLTTIITASLKIFDITKTMTGAKFDTQVLANVMYDETFTNGNNGTGSAAAVVTPTFGLFVSSFRPAAEIRTTGWWNSFANWDWTLDNYRAVLVSTGSGAFVSRSFVNSLVISIPGTLFPLILACMAAYSFSVLKWKGRDTVFVVLFALQIVPLQMALALASFAIFQFLWVWNDLLVGLTFASSEQWPMTAALSDKASANWGQNQHLLTAGAFISMIVPLVVFFSLQKYFVRGLLAGSVKG